MDLKPFAGVARLPFLMLPVALVVVAVGVAAYGGYLVVSRALLALIGLVALHVAVNVLNEWSDMRTGIDLQTQRTPFSGGSGTLPSGALSRRAALGFGVFWAAVGLVIGIWFMFHVGWVILPFMIVGAVFVLGYTDVLARVGLGEIAAGLGLGGLPVVGAALVQRGSVEPTALAAALPATLMTFNLLLLNEYPDEVADRAGGRRNLVILVGRSGAAAIYAAAAILTPVGIVCAVVAGLLDPLALVAVLPSLLLVQPLRWVLTGPSGEVPVAALGANVVWNLTTNVVLGLSLVVATLV